ncbi:unnamed protein product [Fraxinus pennsylvanica]|uniref:NADP-dependent oxidoreductase domain-containing protein n=1 Tax=Fraxinus pennsylvanica TaxID=56036 RepID=A0AAD1ZZG4_9LAMI|nr:unnamed protein product [Fraxinus pennsylvanica]
MMPNPSSNAAVSDNGVNFFDNAEVYANGQAEEIMGQAIKELGWRRSDLLISTKIFWGEGSGPNDKGPDLCTPIEETVRAMNYVIDKGWAFYWGTSECSAQQITEAWAVAERLDLVGPIVEQPEYNLFTRQKVELDYLPLYNKYGLGLTTWSPLASGFLTGKYNSGNIPSDSRFALENYKGLVELSVGFVYTAIILKDYLALRKIIASLPQLCEPAKIHTESVSVAEKAKADAISAVNCD